MSLKRCFVTIPLYYFKNNERNIEFMKTTFKKQLSIILICTMLAVLTACGTDSATTTQSTTESTTAASVSESASSEEASEEISSEELSSEESSTEADAEQTVYPVTVTDQAGREVTIEKEPSSIVSGYYISSSLLIALGLKDKVVGIEAKADKRPIYKLAAPELTELPNVGTAKEFNLETCAALSPDLVILPMKLKDAAQSLTDLGITVLLVNPESQDLLTEMINTIATATNTNSEAAKLLAYIDSQKDMLTSALSGVEPTVKVGYEVVSELPKEAHEHPMLSLDKTKDVGALASWLGGQKGVISWKMDGLTVVLTYENGEMIKAVTRGNGEIGEVITNNAKVFANVPHHIPYKGKLTIRGEAVIKYSDFNAINEKITDAESKYKNPRNLCSGSVRQLDNKITKERNVHFFAFNLVDGEDVDFHNSFKYQLDWLEQQGFTVVEHYLTDSAALPDKVREFSEKITENDFPSDGLVLMLDDLAYGRSLGTTAKFPRNAMAFKWADEEAITHLRYVEWSPSRTGLINPVAVFDPVELEGTTVSRASIHNVSILKSLALGEGDEIAVYKANMIIPQIARNLTMSGNVVIPAACPACGGETEIVREEGGAASGVETLYCTNQFCPAKKLKSFSHYVSRNALNIDGLSEATIEKFIDEKILEELPDLYKLAAHREHIVELEGFGEKSYNKLVAAVDASRQTNMWRLVNGLGIANVGEATAKLMAKHFANDMDAMKKADVLAYVEIDGIGQVIAEDIVRYFENEKNCAIIDRLMAELTFVDEVSDTEQDLAGKVFVITGSLTHFDNRNQLKELIESRGGQVTGSVSAKTSYLINNDVNSTSSKNKKAKSLDVPIISEEDFLELIGQ